MAEILYDVAISFASADRSIALELARRLVAEKYRVFYDQFYQSDLWGQDLAERLTAVYGEQSRYCVIVVSRNYRDRIWTKLEFKSALSTALFQRERAAYILPLRLDDTELPGLLPTIGYLDLRDFGLDEVAELLFQKIGPPGVAESASEAVESSRFSIYPATIHRRWRCGGRAGRGYPDRNQRRESRYRAEPARPGGAHAGRAALQAKR